MHIKPQVFIALFGLLFLAGYAEARDPTFDEVMAIHKVLKEDKCDYSYLGMGERELYVTESGFDAVAKCEDGNTYSYAFDENFVKLDRAPK